MIRRSVAFLAMLALVLIGPRQTHAQDEEDFQCGVESLAPTLDVGYFDTILPEMGCDSGSSYLTPDTISYHIYAIADGDLPRLSMHPEGLVKPSVGGGKLKLKVQDVMEASGKSKGDNVDVAINLFVPVSQLKNVIVEGVDMMVEIINTVQTTEGAAITVKDSGVNNDIYLTSPNSTIYYEASGVKSKIQMEAAAGSSIKLSGVDQMAKIKTIGDDLKVQLSAVNERVYVEGGGFSGVSMSGIDSTVYINGGSCNNIDNSGIKNSCKTTNETVTVPTRDCLIPSKVGKCKNWNDSAWGVAVAGIVVIVLISLCCCGVCIAGIVCFMCCRKNRNHPHPDNRMPTKAQPPVGPTTTTYGQQQQQQQQPENDIIVSNVQPETIPAVTGLGDGIIEAEIISVEDDTARQPSASVSYNNQKGDSAV